jgi:hypothetical protein
MLRNSAIGLIYIQTTSYVRLECGSTLSKKNPIEFELTEGSTGISSVDSGLASPTVPPPGLGGAEVAGAAGELAGGAAGLGSFPPAAGVLFELSLLHAASENASTMTISIAIALFIFSS